MTMTFFIDMHLCTVCASHRQTVYVQECVNGWHPKICCTVWYKQQTRGNTVTVTGSSYELRTCVQYRPKCWFYWAHTVLSINQTHTPADSLNMEWITGSSCQATESGKFFLHTHTHLDNKAFIRKCHFLSFKGGSQCVCESVCLCVFFLDADYSRAFPYLVFPKAQLTIERAANMTSLSFFLFLLRSSYRLL